MCGDGSDGQLGARATFGRVRVASPAAPLAECGYAPRAVDLACGETHAGGDDGRTSRDVGIGVVRPTRTGSGTRASTRGRRPRGSIRSRGVRRGAPSRSPAAAPSFRSVSARSAPPDTGTGRIDTRRVASRVCAWWARHTFRRGKTTQPRCRRAGRCTSGAAASTDRSVAAKRRVNPRRTRSFPRESRRWSTRTSRARKSRAAAITRSR